MTIELASSYGFCFGVKRAIEIAEKHTGSATLGPLIHNQDEINRLDQYHGVKLAKNMQEADKYSTVVIRTHGIPKNDLAQLKKKKKNIIDATCPFVTTPQQIVDKMSQEGYSIIIFGDKDHPEIKGVSSYAKDKDDVFIVLNHNEIDDIKTKSKVAIVSQTTKKPSDFLDIVNKLVRSKKEVRVFNTICNATFENQDAAGILAKKSDIMIIIGGKNSSNTKQLLYISQDFCDDCYHIENEKELNPQWFQNKHHCGISAGASTPDWIVQNVINAITEIKDTQP